MTKEYKLIPKECKRLAEVDFPIAVVSKHSAREKSIRHGHPSTLHLWWARRPLAACRAMLLGLLLPDPCDKHCPDDFKEKARSLLPPVQGAVGSSDMDLRQALLKFIGDFANWDLSSNQLYLEVSRGLVKAAHPEETPLVVDPFAGGGSIPLEALRLGCEAFASDLNPVACLIQKVMLEDIPRWGRQKVKVKRQNGEEVEADGLAEALRIVGKEIKEAAEKELAEFYPPDPDGSRPIAYLWARTVQCEEPECGAEIPLLRTNWLAKRYSKSRRQYTKLVSLDLHGNSKTKIVNSQITVHNSPTVTLPMIPSPTVTGGKALCPCCKKTMSDVRVRAQLTQQKGCTDAMFNDKGERISGAKLMATILRKPGQSGLIYRLPTNEDTEVINKAHKLLMQRVDSSNLPSEPLSPIRPSPNARGVSGATRIGITDYGRLFTSRQKLSLSKLSMIINSQTINPSIQHILALAITKLSERSTSFVTWINSTEAPRGTFARQALTIAWDFIELVPVVGEEEFLELVAAMAQVIEHEAKAQLLVGQVQQAKAAELPLPDESVSVWFTDPPYYDSVPYADLSDIFYVWLKRLINQSTINKFEAESVDGLTPKADECTWNQAHIVNGIAKTPAYFEKSMSIAFAEGNRVLSERGIGCVVFAHKSTEGWEALLSGMLYSGWVIVASWPITTERGARLNANETAALSASIHLVCRPRPENAPVGDWGDVLRELPKRVGDWMERLQKEHIRGADLVFACIGPALEIFSRYSKVETAEGREVKLAEYLEKVWEVVGRMALEQVLGTAEAKARNGAGAIEEDARLTALFLWTLQSTNGNGEEGKSKKEKGKSEEEETAEEADEDDESPKGKSTKGFSLVFDVVRRFAQPLGIHLQEWEGRIIETQKGVVRLLSVSERAKQLFGEESAQAGMTAIADQLESGKSAQLTLFAGSSEDNAPVIKGRRQKKDLKNPPAPPLPKGGNEQHRGATTLDRVHAAMLLQASGRANALRALLKAEQERSPDFLRLANALSALYPKGSEEKRLLDAMLLAVPR